MSVLLPAPFSPRRAWISPQRISRSTPSSATTPGKDLVIPCREKSGTSVLSVTKTPALTDAPSAGRTFVRSIFAAYGHRPSFAAS